MYCSFLVYHSFCTAASFSYKRKSRKTADNTLSKAVDAENKPMVFEGCQFILGGSNSNASDSWIINDNSLFIRTAAGWNNIRIYTDQRLDFIAANFAAADSRGCTLFVYRIAARAQKTGAADSIRNTKR